ncbi:hypothetical protein CBW16_04435 [Flavobacteriaceae bacterium JJC]|nr:hypothetical protein CBW16_04435 [Flavobacteriaceae bacterium JJC]
MRIILLLHCCFVLLLNCQTATFQKNSNNQNPDQSFVGTWSGALPNSKSPIHKSWQITRKSDGSFTKSEILSIKGRMQKINRKGTWWIKDGMYYEKYDLDEIYQIMEYKLLKDHKIQFTSKEDGSVSVESPELQK